MKKITPLLLALLLAATSAGCSQPADDESGSLPPEQSESQSEAQAVPEEPEFSDPIATLGNYTITLDDYRFFFRTMQYNLEYQAEMSGYTADTMAEFWTLDQDGQQMQERLKEESLFSAKQYAILYSLAQEAGTLPNELENLKSDEQIDGLLEALNKDEALFRTTYGLASAKIRTMYHRINLVNQYEDDLAAAVNIKDEEIQAAYDADPDVYDKVTVRHVLILSNDSMSEDEQKQAKEKADDLLVQVQEGADIGVLAAAHSEDPGSKDENGEYTFGRGEMVPEFEQWAYAAAPGDCGVVQTSYGYHVMQMIARMDYEQAKAEIAESMRRAQAREMVDAALEQTASPDWTLDEALLNSITVAPDAAE